MINNASLYGINQGEAQILPSNPVIPLLRQQVVQEQQKKEAQAQAAAQQLAKLNFDKVKSSDVPDFMTGYNDIKNDYGQLQAEQDPVKRVALQNKIDQKKVLFQQHVANSQALLAHEQELAKVPLNPNAHVKDDYADQVAKLSGLKSSDPEYGKAATYFGAPFKDKDYDMNAATQGLLKSSLDATDGGYTVAKLPNGVKQVYENKGSELNKDKFLNGTLQKMSGDDAFRRQVMKQYPGVDPHVAAKNYANDIYELHKDDLTSSPKAVATQWPQRIAPMTAFEQWKIAHGVGDAATAQMSPEQILIANMKTQQPGSGEKFMSLVPNGQYGNEKPTIHLNEDGTHRFSFPPQLAVDAAATKKNGNPTIYTKSPGKVYTLNPKSDTYMADVAQMAKEQNVDLGRLNTVEAKKGGRGQIDAATTKGAEKIKGTNLKLY